MRTLLLSIIFLFTYTLAQAQEPSTVTIRLTNEKKEALAAASVSLASATDSATRLQKITDSAGIAVFQLLPGQYIINASYINLQPIERRVTVSGKTAEFSFILSPTSNKLSGVVVTANRPLMRQEDDKTIVDPEALAVSSTNAFEIMEKTPGLFVDQDGNIYLNSTTPATIYINGREQKMSAADIATILKSLPPNSISSIEIMRTPSARYDASGSGGIVNVVLKKGVRIGLTGSVNAALNQGTYGNQILGININNNNGNTNMYLNLQYSRRNTYDRIRTDRIFAADSMLSQDAFTRYNTGSYYVGAGAGYTLGKKWELNWDGRLSYNSSDNNSRNISVIKRISTNQDAVNNTNLVYNDVGNLNYSQGISAKFKIDSLGSEWTSDLSFVTSPNNTDQDFSTAYLLPFQGKLDASGRIENSFHYYSAQTNYLKKLPRTITVETGLKSSLVQFRNSTRYTSLRAYRYRENINSAYLQASKKFGSILVKLGTRVENTNMIGQQTAPNDTSFTLRRTDPFPYIYISRSLMNIAGYDIRAYLVYRRTISRPAYEYLNPSERRVDQYLFETGNPSLRPQFTKNYEANISADERPIFAIGHNDTKDIFTQVVYQADSSNAVAYRTYDNLGTNKELYFRGLAAIPPGKKYFFVVGAQYNRNFYQGLYENKPLSFRKGSWTFFTYQTLKVTPLTQFSVQGFVRLKGQQQFYELSTFGALNLSLSQQFFKKKMTLTLNAQDVFFTNKNEFTLAQGSVNASGYRESDTRRFGLNLRYNFGFRKKEESNLFNIESPEGRQ
jgi:hypothetical protein